MVASVKEEKGPKCVACEEGYTAKPAEILGMYVFAKRMPFKEWASSPAQGHSSHHGYTSVTHANFIHVQCHQEACRVDRERQQPIREWDGAKIRNHMTLCNNLFPVFGGTIPKSSYTQAIDRYF